MLVDYSTIKHIYFMAGKTDLRLGIDGLALRVHEKYQLDLYDEAVFFFATVVATNLKSSTGTTMGFT